MYSKLLKQSNKAIEYKLLQHKCDYMYIQNWTCKNFQNLQNFEKLQH